MRKRKTIRFTRLYTWTAPRKNMGMLNLKKYADKIGKAVIDVLPDDYDAFIYVDRDYFIIDTAKPIFQSQAQWIGRKLAQTKEIGILNTPYNYKDDGHCKQIFVGMDISM